MERFRCRGVARPDRISAILIFIGFFGIVVGNGYRSGLESGGVVRRLPGDGAGGGFREFF